jgi:hypothetical protein
MCALYGRADSPVMATAHFPKNADRDRATPTFVQLITTGAKSFMRYPTTGRSPPCSQRALAGGVAAGSTGPRFNACAGVAILVLAGMVTPEIGWARSPQDLNHADLSGQSLAGEDLEDADLSFAELTGINLAGANLTSAKMTRANLTFANLTGANLTGAQLNGAQLNGAQLNGAQLTGANLTFANLSGANLTGASLTGANLTGADLAFANLTGAKLDEACGDANTKVPDGLALLKPCRVP